MGGGETRRFYFAYSLPFLKCFTRNSAAQTTSSICVSAQASPSRDIIIFPKNFLIPLPLSKKNRPVRPLWDGQARGTTHIAVTWM